MPIEAQNIQLMFNKGLNVKSDNKQSMPGEMILLENAVFTTVNEFRKRNGYTPLSRNIEGGSSSITAGVSGTVFKDEVLEFDGTTAYSYSESTNAWTSKGSIVQIGTTSNSINQTSNSNRNQDSAYHSSGVALVAWEATSTASAYLGVYYSIYDVATGNIIYSTNISAVSKYPKCFVLGDVFILTYYDGTSALKYLTIPTGSPSISTTSTLASDVNTTNYFYDGVNASGGIYFAYNTNDGGGSVAVKFLNSSQILSVRYVLVTGDAASRCINIFTNTAQSYFWLCYYNASDVKALIFDTTFSIVKALSTIETVAGVRNIAGYADTTTGTILYEVYTAAAAVIDATWGLYCKVRTNTLSTSAVGTAASFVLAMGIASKWFKRGSDWYIVLAFQSRGAQAATNYLGPENTYFIFNSSGVAHGKAISLLGGGYTNTVNGSTSTASTLAEVNAIDSDNFYCALLNQPNSVSGVGSSTFVNYGVTLCKFSFDSSQNYNFAEMGNNLLVSGSVVRVYDGLTIPEFGFHLFPLCVKTGSGGTSGSMSDGTYSYMACYKWIDNFGQIHRSAMSDASNATLSSITLSGGGSNQSVPLSIMYLPFTQKNTVVIEIYRSDAGAAYKLLTTITNSTSSTTATYTDTTASVSTNPLAYTTGGVVSNDALPPTSILTTFKNRIIAIPSENPRQFYYSKEIVPGSPPEFSIEFVQNINTRNEEVMGAIQMDDKLVLGTRNNIFFIVGDGPSDNGSQNDYSESQIVSTGVGVNTQKSLVLFPLGILFESIKGRYLLDRSLQVQYLGADVESYNSDPTVSATLVPDTTQVRMIMESGNALVYDYFVNQWSVFTNHSAVNSFVYNNKFCYVNSSGQVMVEDDSFKDNGSFYALKFTTAWLSFAGVQGYQRLRKMLFLGEYESPHKLRISFAYDWDSTVQQSTVIDVNSLYPLVLYGESTPYGDEDTYGGTFPDEQFRVFLDRQKCDAIQVTVEDLLATTPGEGLSFSNISFEVGVKKGLNKLPATQSFGGA